MLELSSPDVDLSLHITNFLFGQGQAGSGARHVRESAQRDAQQLALQRIDDADHAAKQGPSAGVITLEDSLQDFLARGLWAA